MTIRVTLTKHEATVAANAIQVQAEGAEQVAEEAKKERIFDYAEEYKRVGFAHRLLEKKFRLAASKLCETHDKINCLLCKEMDDLADLGRPGGGR